jgi:2-keto-4-pentenoate hydratase/2-oxohepta-3-ene-1,7-dioic acid hydratase in catechol pathway
MRLVVFSLHGSSRQMAPRAGLLVEQGTLVVDLVAAMESLRIDSGAPGPESLAWFDLDGPWVASARQVAARLARDAQALGRWQASGGAYALTEVQLRPPVLRPGKIVCVGLNYRDHVAETGRTVPEAPTLFAKFPSALLSPGGAIVLPRSSQRVDFEAELAVVIGRRARDVHEERALDQVFGYANGNDVTARDFQKRDGQWSRAKSCDTFAPLGPAVVTSDEVPDPNALAIRCRLNGGLMQESNTSEMVFPVRQVIAFISQTMTLEPGDIIFTGTPSGVGYTRQPPVYLRAGDTVEVEIEGLGVLRNTVVGPAPA